MAQSRPYGFPPREEPSDDEAEMAAYIAAMTRELAELARHSRLEIVAYLLDIVHLEASGVVTGPHRTTFTRRLDT